MKYRFYKAAEHVVMVAMLCVVCAQRFQARFGVVVCGRQNLRCSR